MKINNLPTYAMSYEWIVARATHDELWFYGAYDNSNKAVAVAQEVNGIVVRSDEVDAN